MKCAWQAYLNLLPHWMRQEVDKQGREELQELRIRIERKPEMILKSGVLSLSLKEENRLQDGNASDDRRR